MRPNVLFVEDEEDLRMTVGDRLRSEGYIVDYAADGDEGFEKATQLPFDLIILDLMLPHRGGLSICRDLREAGLITPLLMLTAKGRTEDKIRGLKTGADDYVTKPFDMQELVARIGALLRRAPIGSTGKRNVYQFGTIRVDRRATDVTRDGKPVSLSVREFQLLLYLIENPGVTVSREQLLVDVWGYNGKIFTRTVDVHIASLRQKLENDPKRPMFIQTVQRVGYKFTPEVVTP
jgi:two-component system, OmpR family, alkaline phosphatase synthesis response regulator PhoP